MVYNPITMVFGSEISVQIRFENAPLGRSSCSRASELGQKTRVVFWKESVRVPVESILRCSSVPGTELRLLDRLLDRGPSNEGLE